MRNGEETGFLENREEERALCESVGKGMMIIKRDAKVGIDPPRASFASSLCLFFAEV